MSRLLTRSRLYLTTAIIAIGLVGSAGPATALAATPATHTITSPDGRVQLIVSDDASGKLTYRVTENYEVIISDSPLGIVADGVDYSTGLSYVGETRAIITETYSLPAGTDASYLNDGREMTLTYTKSGHTMQIVARAYNDGVAYRYVLPETGGVATITQESSGFRLPTGTGGWAAVWAQNYEQDYIYRNASQLNSGTGYTMPLLASINNNKYFALITEANMYNSGASYAPGMLQGDGAGTGLLRLARTPDQAFPLVATYPFQTPWRVVTVADDLDELYNSDLVQNLNPPATVDSTWVHPGRAAWSWYSDTASASDLAKQEQLVDFAESMGFEYVTVDCCYNRATDLPAISSYAAEHGVDIFAWVNAEPFATPAQANALMAEHAAYGVKGLKVDFFLNDSQAVQQWYQSIGDAAGAYHLMLDLHGSTKPGGENRTWPWVITSEAVAGTEHYMYPPATTARQDVTYPWTRGPLGSMDYTPAMISQNDAVLTQSHVLAQAIVFSTGMINYADSAAAYEQWPGRYLMRAIPTVWDETHVVEGFPGDHITLARRSGDDWFVGAMTSPARTATVPLSFLGSGTYTATVFADDAYGRLWVSTQTVTNTTTLTVPMIATGGAAVHISRIALPLIGSADTRYEAESGANTLTGWSSAGACRGCSMGWNVNNIGSGGALRFNGVTVPESGTYRMTFTYTLADPRSVRISVNGNVLGTYAVPTSGGWESMGKYSVDVPLVAGANSITFDNPNGWVPGLDALTLERSYEAESSGSTASGGAYALACGGCSGGMGIGGLDGTGRLTVANVTVTTPGNHTVKVDFNSPSAQSIQYRVNGGAWVTTALHATGDASTHGTVTLGVQLGAGANTIEFGNATSVTAIIDRVSVVI